ncbi:hypothetical protein [uncultured Oscillibacter sp.]|uniref:hypothetical protein n=1 Tax=uncultured Oscillibacter sp. TaxID=876091 RepID=UPI0026E45B03|nr:hypothetical protein [uncultured Oscillibacter sp.]
MDNELYLIHEDDYLRHIDHKLEMYDLVLELVRTLREDLAEGETARAVRDLCSYEQQAHILFEGWTIPDEYAESGDPDDLAQLMEEELLPAGDGEEDSEDDGEGKSLSELLLRTAELMTRSAATMLDASRCAVDAEFRALMDRLDNMERPENDCAG